MNTKFKVEGALHHWDDAAAPRLVVDPSFWTTQNKLPTQYGYIIVTRKGVLSHYSTILSQYFNSHPATYSHFTEKTPKDDGGMP